MGRRTGRKGEKLRPRDREEETDRPGDLEGKKKREEKHQEEKGERKRRKEKGREKGTKGRERSEGQRKKELPALWRECDRTAPGQRPGGGQGTPRGPWWQLEPTPLPPRLGHPGPLSAHTAGGADSPWKQSRYSSRCPAPFTCTIDTGKLLEEEANTAGAKEWSFLSRNSVKAGERRGFRNRPQVPAGPERCVGREHAWAENTRGPTLKRVLLHVNFVEFIGSDEDTVVGEVDAAAGL